MSATAAVKRTAKHVLSLDKKKRRKVDNDSADDIIPARSDDEGASDADENGNLAGFVVDSEEDDNNGPTEEKEQTADEVVQELVDGLSKEEKELMIQSMQSTSAGVRRSRRSRKEPQRFFPKDYVDTFLKKGGTLAKEDIDAVYNESSEEEIDDDDEDFENNDSGSEEQEDLLGYGC